MNHYEDDSDAGISTALALGFVVAAFGLFAIMRRASASLRAFYELLSKSL